MSYLLGLAVSFLCGFLGVNLLRTYGRIDPFLHLIAAVGLGLALSAQIIFYSLFVLGHFNFVFVTACHVLIFLALVLLNARFFKHDISLLFPKFPPDRTAWLGLMILSLLLLPLWREAHFFPFGGWDAWACWNFKAKMIFLGGDSWKQMLDVSMWRSNNQYPFLLPLMNAWGWMFTRETSVLVPMAHTIIFTFLTALALFWSFKRRTQSLVSTVPPLVLFTVPFVNTLSISQYSDIVVSFFLLGTLTCLYAAREDNNTALAILSGMMCGAMGFVKTEGALAGMIIAMLAVPYLWDRQKESWNLLGPFLTATIASALPAVLFQIFWATPNVSFINGLTSADHPVTFERIKAVILFLGLELISLKWNGLWILLVVGGTLAGRRLVQNGSGLIGIFLGIYQAGALFFYAINTHYEILWWLGATLNRILYTALPVFVWWVFSALTISSNKK